MKILAYVLALTLAACGGGGEDTITPTLPPTPALELSLTATAPNDDLQAELSTPATQASALTCGYATGANTIQGVVQSVHDGDTITVNSINIRLDSIDAPELKQTYGAQAQASLSNLVLSRHVVVAYTKTDKYGRVVGSVFTDDCNLVNLTQVATGSAWYYQAYQCEISTAMRNAYATAQQSAQDRDIGLWASVATPPWIYRNGTEPKVPACTSESPSWTGNPSSPVTPPVVTPPVVTPPVVTPPVVTPPVYIPNPSTGCFKVWVNGYRKSNGTWVNGYYRNSPGCA